MMMIENTQRSFDRLPQEIIEEILSTLEVKSLLRFKCVSKSYRSLIDSKPFIKTHLLKSKKDTSLAHHWVLRVLIWSRPEEVSGCSLLSLIDNSDNGFSELNFPTNFPSYSSITLVGCCNGLVCILLDILTNSAQFILWNPSTRIFKKLPDLDKKNKKGRSGFQCFGFGWDESSDDYKVIANVRFENQTIYQIYSLKADSWEQLNAYCDIECGHFSGTSMLISGKLHRAHDDITKSCPHQWEIVAFDLKAEVFEIVEQPCYSEGSITCQCLGTFGECLAVLCFYENGDEQIWALKEYGVKESWEKVMVINNNDGFRIWTSPSVAAFCNDEKREIILMNLENEMHYLVYDLKNICFHGMIGLDECDIYTESLVSPLE